jgi:hypothetical protein
MKLFKLIIFFLLLAFVSNHNAQGLFRYFNWSAYSDGPERIDHVVLDFNHDRFQLLPQGVTQGYFSFGVNAYLFHDRPLNKKGTLAFAIGAGVSSFNIHNNAQFSYTENDEGNLITEFTPFAEGLEYKKNKLSLNYLEIPVEFRIRTMKIDEEDKSRTNFRLYLGFKAGYLLSSHTKYKDDDSKIKVYNIKNLLEYRYGPTLRIGFKKIGFQAFYSMTSIFKTGLGPELYPFSLGITWMRF